MKYDKHFWDIYNECVKSELSKENQINDLGLGIFELPKVKPQPEQHYLSESNQHVLSEILIKPGYKPQGKDDDQKLDIIPNWNPRIHDNLYDKVIRKLKDYGLSPDSNHQISLKKMVRVVLGNKNLKRPIILPVSPGMGKTTLLIELLINRLKYDDKWSAVIVVERAQDIHRLIGEIKKRIPDPSLAAWPTFTTMLKCPAGYGYFDYKRCSKCNTAQYKCKVQQDLTIKGMEPVSFREVLQCPSGKKGKDYHNDVCNHCSRIINPNACDPGIKSDIRLNKRVIFITHQYYYNMLEYHGSLEGLLNFRYNGYYLRRNVFVDERPILTDTNVVAFSLFEEALSIIRKLLPTYLNGAKDALRDGLNLYYLLSNRIVNGIGGFKWPRGLKLKWEQAWKEGKHQERDLLHTLEKLLNDGGYYMSNHKAMKEVITLAHYVEAHKKDNRTVIFDGTGLNDKLYDQYRFNVLESVFTRDYSNLHHHIYQKNLSLTFYREKADDTFYNEFCKTISQTAGSSKTLVVGYKDYIEEFRKRLTGSGYYFDYWGNILGKNDYSCATIVFFTGVIDFGNHVYSAYAKILSGNNPIQSLKKEKDDIRTNQKLVMLYQVIYRSKLRKYTQNEIHVYLPTTQKLANELHTMFGGSHIHYDWFPRPDPHKKILLKIKNMNSGISDNEVIRKFVIQEKTQPNLEAIKQVWQNKGKQQWSRLRNKIAKDELAKLGGVSKSKH